MSETGMKVQKTGIKSKDRFEHLLPLKRELQKRREELTKMRMKRKEAEHGHVPNLLEKSFEYRHFHIAYCELRGRERPRIERPVRAKELNETKIKNIKEKYLRK